MRKIILFTLMVASAFMATSQKKVLLTVGHSSMEATLVDNTATSTLLSLLEKGPITIQMSDYGGFEKVGALPQSLPTSNTQITTEPGDIMLYQGNNMVIFYGTNSWSYTRLGRIDGATAETIRQFLGSGNISLTLSLGTPSGIAKQSADIPYGDKVYDLNGALITTRPLPAGIYVINGKKTVIHEGYSR